MNPISLFINFAVDGQTFSIFKTNLLKHPQSVLCQFVNGITPRFIGYQFGGTFYMDRDPTSFYYVSKYLQGYRLDEFDELTGNIGLLRRIYNDAIYYGLPELALMADKLVNEIEPKVTEETVKESVRLLKGQMLSYATAISLVEDYCLGTKYCDKLTNNVSGYLSRPTVTKKMEDYLRKHMTDTHPVVDFLREITIILLSQGNTESEKEEKSETTKKIEEELSEMMKDSPKPEKISEPVNLLNKLQEISQNIKLEDLLELLKRTNMSGINDIIGTLKTSGVIKL